MGIKAIFMPEYWAAVPFHFWSVVFFTLGSMVGSFLNVCIHRLPLEESVVSPPSHCPHCKYSIPAYLNIPLVTWLFLRGKCANCGAPISSRYFLVELLTGVTFLACWLLFGHQSAGLALVNCLLLSGLIAASFIDLEHFIIPDEITFGGVGAGLVCSFLVPIIHGRVTRWSSVGQSVLGALVGAGLIYFVVRLGKLIFGRQKFSYGAPFKVVFNETALVLPDQEIAFEEIFYRKSDTIKLKASVLELCDRCYKDVWVRLSPTELRIDDEKFNPDDIPFMEATTELVVVPREAMGLGDVKFMAAIGSFLGWQAVIFSLGVSSMVGSVFGLTMIALKRLGKGRPVPYGPYIAIATAIWVFGGGQCGSGFGSGECGKMETGMWSIRGFRSTRHLTSFRLVSHFSVAVPFQFIKNELQLFFCCTFISKKHRPNSRVGNALGFQLPTFLVIYRGRTSGTQRNSVDSISVYSHLVSD